MSNMVMFLSAAAALLVLISRADQATSVCPRGIDNGTDVQLTLSCSTLNPVVGYRANTTVLRDFIFYGNVAVEYTCTNSSSMVVAEGIALNNVYATATSSHIEPTLASGVDCTFSGCYASTVFPNNWTVTTLAIKPTPCTVDIDECSRGLHNCSENAVCRNTRTSYFCECNFGYEGDGLNCSNVEECLIGSDNCSDNAVCTDTVGGYNCTCTSGFEGDGFTCSNIEECLIGADNCSDNAVCTDTVGGYNCTCTSGFEGDGFTCSNIEECLIGAHNCSDNAVCTDTVGGYNCTCTSGFEGDGFTCSNINECLIAAENNCSANAVCTDTVGGYNCTCTIGYEGDGLTCSNVDECDRQGNTLLCDANAECTDTEGSFACHCNHGYTGDGFACTSLLQVVISSENSTVEAGSTVLLTCVGFGDPVPSVTWSTQGVALSNSSQVTIYEELGTEDGVDFVQSILAISDVEEPNGGHYTCTVGNTLGNASANFELYVTATGDVGECHNCDPNAECVNTNGGYSCICVAGYEGSGRTCNNIDECLEGSHTCHVGAECIDTMGGYNCSCWDGYYWDGFACQLPEDIQMLKVAIAAALAVLVAAGILAALLILAAVIWRRVHKYDAKTCPLEMTFKDKIDLDFFPIDLKASQNFALQGSVVSLFDTLRQPIPAGTGSPCEGSQENLGAVAHGSSIDSGWNEGAGSDTVAGIPASKKVFQKFSVTDNVCETGNLQRSLQRLCDSGSGTPPSKPPRTGTVSSADPTHQRVTLSRSCPTQQPDSLPRSDQQLTATPPRTHPFKQQAKQLFRSDPVHQLSKTVTRLQSRPIRLSLPTKCDGQTAGEHDQNPCSPTSTSFKYQTLLCFPNDDSGFYQDSEGYIKNSSKSGSEMNSGNVTPSLKDRQIVSKMDLQYDVNTCDNANSPSTEKLPTCTERTRYSSEGEEGYMETKLPHKGNKISTV